jgi:hypothetical protein
MAHTRLYQASCFISIEMAEINLALPGEFQIMSQASKKTLADNSIGSCEVLPHDYMELSAFEHQNAGTGSATPEEYQITSKLAASSLDTILREEVARTIFCGACCF